MLALNLADHDPGDDFEEWQPRFSQHVKHTFATILVSRISALSSASLACSYSCFFSFLF